MPVISRCSKALAAGVVGDDAPKGVLLNTLLTPPCEFRLLGKSEALAVVSTAASNKKLPKMTPLVSWDQNTSLSRKVTEGLAFDVEPKTVIFSKEAKECMTLAKAFKEHYKGYKQVFSYQPFPAGALPKILVPTSPTHTHRLDLSDASFNANRASIMSAIELARGAPGLQLVWMMKGDAKKEWIQPCGLMIVTSSPMILSPAQEHRFTGSA